LYQSKISCRCQKIVSVWQLYGTYQ
jgi:hypothetical protein